MKITATIKTATLVAFVTLLPLHLGAQELDYSTFINRVMQSIRTRGVKYCPAPDFFSFAFFSNRPS